MVLVVLMSGIAGLLLVAGWVAARVFAQSRSEPALGERYVHVPGGDLTLRRDRSTSDSGGSGNDCDGSDGGDDGD